MEGEYIFRHIQELVTPVGYFAVYDKNDKVSFSVIRNALGVPAGVYDSNRNKIGTIHTDTNYQIIIEANKFEIGKEYAIKFSSGKWEYCDSDEHTTCYCTFIDEWAVGIGAYDPNDYLKDRQIWEYSKQQGFLKRKVLLEPPVYDESNFEKYTVKELEDLNGYKFKLFDYTSEYVRFEVAWVQVKKYPAIEYEGALALWLS